MKQWMIRIWKMSIHKENKKKIYIGIGVVICLVLAMLASYLQSRRVHVVRPIPRTAPFTYVAEERLTPLGTHMVKGPFTGRVDSFQVRVGDAVSIGSVLGTWDTEFIQTQVDMLERGGEDSVSSVYTPSTYDASQDAYLIKLLSDGVITKKEYELRKKKMESRNTQVVSRSNDASFVSQQLSTWKSLLQNPQIRSPYAGVVKKIYGEESHVVLEGVPFMLIEDTSQMTMGLVVPGVWQYGDAEVYLEESGNVYEGKISKAQVGTDTEGKHTLLRIVWNNESGKLNSRQNYRVLVTSLSKKHQLWIPVSALHRDDYGYYLYLMTPNRLVDVRYVDIGKQEDGFVPVMGDVSEEDMIIDGTRVWHLGDRVFVY